MEEITLHLNLHRKNKSARTILLEADIANEDLCQLVLASQMLHKDENEQV